MKTLGNRMKENYEDRYKIKLTRRMPVIMRLDGKAFHTLTRGCDKPFDEKFKNCMLQTAETLFKETQGAKIAYVQSDEISVLLTDFDTLQTDAWFDYSVQKMCSVAAGFAAVSFTAKWGPIGVFDCRVFNVPKEEVCNYFIWRQKDWGRNSIQMLSRVFFSAKQLHGKKIPDMHEMLHTKGVNWAELSSEWKNGSSILKVGSGLEITGDVVFAQNREIVERYLVNI